LRINLKPSKMSSLAGWAAETINYSDLVADSQSVACAISKLEIFLGEANMHIRRQNERNAKHTIRQMVDVGRIVKNSASYSLLNKFYLKHFNEEAPYYVVRSAQRQRFRLL